LSVIYTMATKSMENIKTDEIKEEEKFRIHSM
jgi:hypothetical protein